MISSMSLLVGGASFMLCCVVAASILILRENQIASLINQRLQTIRQATDQQSGTRARLSTASVVGALGTLVARSGILPTRTLIELEMTLRTASLGGANGLAIFVGAKAALAVVFPVVALVFVRSLSLPSVLHFVLPAFSLAGGLVLPDYIVGRRRARYLRAVAAALPDALDLMVICSNAGLGLEPAISRVGDELRDAHPQMANELRMTAHELQMISDRRQVLRGMGDRTQLDSFRRLASVLTQTLQFGTPLTQALKTLAAEMRQESMTHFEGRAAKLPVMLTFPMILFILPCVFIVVGGPAVIEVIGVLGKH
jgi:tight adherence protein C